jgi:hypothetical protein
MSEEKLVCRACGSQDTVSYWHKVDVSTCTSLLMSAYPRAIRCVDCGDIEHDPSRRRAYVILGEAFSSIRKAP